MQFKPFLESGGAVLPEFDGYKYENAGGTGGGAAGSTRDIKALVDDIYEITARAFQIPSVLVQGQVEGTQDANGRFLTYCIDPICDQLQEEIVRKRYGFEKWRAGTYLRIDSSSIIHFDLFANAANVEKLVGSGVFSINDIRAAAGQAILARLLGGETCALVTDAGTPAISDPGEDLVRLCSENGVTVQAVPGCCAAVCALAVSGLPTGRFTFEGFLSANRKERRTRLQELAGEERTMVFHEAPHKLRATLGDMAELLGGGRHVALCRELTKLHEQTMRTTLAAAVEHYRETEPRGEYVLVVAGAPRQEKPAVTLESGAQQVLRLREEGARLKDAAREVAAATGLNKNELYNAALRLEKE